MADHGEGAADAASHLSTLHQGHEQPPPVPPVPPPQLPLRSPHLYSAGIVVVDITEKFASAVNTLEPGELVKDGFFTLFDSVAALEIMDPKMDSGCIEPGEEIEVSYDVSQPLDPEQVLGIIDQLICHEMSWHLGYPLSQTIFTSVYVEALLMPEPESLQQAHFVRDGKPESDREPMLQILRAYCLGMLKACGFVTERVKSEHFYEEEDFVPNTYNRDLLTNIPTHDIQQVLTEAAELVQTLKSRSTAENVADALVSRLDLRRVFLSATESPQYVKEPQKAIDPWQKALELLPRIEMNHSLAKAVDEAFSVKLQRKLTSTIPPRPVVQLSFEDAFRDLTRLLRDGQEAIGVLNYTDSQCLQTFVNTFQAKKPQPMVFVRTLLQTFLFSDMEILGSMSIRQLLDDDLSLVTLPASVLLDRNNDNIEAVHDLRFIMSQQMELFRQRAAPTFLDTFRTACQNRCRVRRTLCHLIYDWENLQSIAEDTDEFLQNKALEQPLPPGLMPPLTNALPLSSWAFLYKLRHMESIVQLGFELHVYQVDEMAGMYWYLNYLARTRLDHVERIKPFVAPDGIVVSRDDNDPVRRSLIFIHFALLDATVIWHLSKALSCIYALLERKGLIRSPPRPFSNDQLRYNLRMKPFASIGLPALPTYDEYYQESKHACCSTRDLLEMADMSVTAAKKGFEELSRMPPRLSFSVGCHDRYIVSIKAALKACIATSVTIATLRRALSAGRRNSLSAHVPAPDEAYHEWWIVPRVTIMSS